MPAKIITDRRIFRKYCAHCLDKESAPSGKRETSEEKESQKLIINVKQIDQSIENVILMRKLKRINYKQCCLKLKSLYNKRKRQIRRQINFFNKYTLKYDYYYPLIDMNNYIDVFYKCRKSTAFQRTNIFFCIFLIPN